MIAIRAPPPHIRNRARQTLCGADFLCDQSINAMARAQARASLAAGNSDARWD